MELDLTKAKIVLGKAFCFTEHEVREARRAGKKLMEKEDIEFILSVPGTTKEELCFFSLENNGVEVLLAKIEESKAMGLVGVILDTDLSTENLAVIKARNYIVRHTNHGSVFWDEIYFSEEGAIRAEIDEFQNLFEGLRGVAHCF